MILLHASKFWLTLIERRTAYFQLCSFIVLERPAVSCFRGKFKAPFTIQTTLCGQQMRDLAVLQQQSRQSINFCDHHSGCVPLRPVKWPFVSSSSSEVKLGLVQLPRVPTAGSALCPDRPLDPADTRWGRHSSTLAANIKSVNKAFLRMNHFSCHCLASLYCCFLMLTARHIRDTYFNAFTMSTLKNPSLPFSRWTLCSWADFAAVSSHQGALGRDLPIALFLV